jgi:hypothetical protein
MGHKLYVIKVDEDVFLISGNATCKTLGVDCQTCEEDANADENQKHALKNLKTAA